MPILIFPNVWVSKCYHVLRLTEANKWLKEHKIVLESSGSFSLASWSQALPPAPFVSLLWLLLVRLCLLCHLPLSSLFCLRILYTLSSPILILLATSFFLWNSSTSFSSELVSLQYSFTWSANTPSRAPGNAWPSSPTICFDFSLFKHSSHQYIDFMPDSSSLPRLTLVPRSFTKANRWACPFHPLVLTMLSSSSVSVTSRLTPGAFKKHHWLYPFPTESDLSWCGLQTSAFFKMSWKC